MINSYDFWWREQILTKWSILKPFLSADPSYSINIRIRDIDPSNTVVSSICDKYIPEANFVSCSNKIARASCHNEFKQSRVNHIIFFNWFFVGWGRFIIVNSFISDGRSSTIRDIGNGCKLTVKERACKLIWFLTTFSYSIPCTWSPDS